MAKNKYNNPHIKGIDRNGNPIGDPYAILAYDQQQQYYRDVGLVDNYKQKGGEKKVFKKWTEDEKRYYAKQFHPAQRESYRKGKRAGFLDGVHAPKKKK